MAGQNDNRYGDRDSKPITGVAAPTTSTPGYIGQIIIDTNGNEWKYKGMRGANHLWVAPVNYDTNADYALYVSPTGSDSNTGTEEASPFATVARAFQYIERMGSNLSIEVYLLDGTYTENLDVRCMISTVRIIGKSNNLANVIWNGYMNFENCPNILVYYMTINAPATKNCLTFQYSNATAAFLKLVNGGTGACLGVSRGFVSCGITTFDSATGTGAYGINNSFGMVRTQNCTQSGGNFAIAGTQTTSGIVYHSTNFYIAGTVNDSRVFGGMIVRNSTQVTTDTTTTANANSVGTIRYRTDANNSYCEMIMQTADSTYAWVEIKKNTW